MSTQPMPTPKASSAPPKRDSHPASSSSSSSVSTVGVDRPRRAATLGKKKYTDDNDDDDDNEEENDDREDGDFEDPRQKKKKPPKRKREKKERNPDLGRKKRRTAAEQKTAAANKARKTIDLTDESAATTTEPDRPLSKWDPMISAAAEYEKERLKKKCDECVKQKEIDGKLCNDCTPICVYCRLEKEDCKCMCAKCGLLKICRGWLGRVVCPLFEAYRMDECECGPFCKLHPNESLCPDCESCFLCDSNNNDERCGCWEDRRPTDEDLMASVRELKHCTGPPKLQSLVFRPRRRHTTAK